MVQQDPDADRAPADQDAVREPGSDRPDQGTTVPARASAKGKRKPKNATPEADGAACADPPEAAATTASPPAPEAPPVRDFALLLPLLMARGVLDAVDLCTIACCTFELQLAVEGAWARFCAGDPTVVLRSVARPVDDPMLNKVKHAEYAPVGQAKPCLVCKRLTRYRHPVEGSLLCTPCGKSSENKRVSPFRMTSQGRACRDFGVAKTADLRLLLRWTERKLPWSSAEKKMVWTNRYAPAIADSLKSVLPGEDGVEPPRPPTDLYGNPSYVFLQREIVCLLLEKYGGPRLLTERLLNQDLPFLDPNDPDK